MNHDRLKLCTDRTISIWLSRMKKKQEEQKKDTELELYCICQKPYNNKLIQCDSCDEWFHGSCVNITPNDAMGIDMYSCPNCN